MRATQQWCAPWHAGMRACACMLPCTRRLTARPTLRREVAPPARGIALLLHLQAHFATSIDGGHGEEVCGAVERALDLHGHGRAVEGLRACMHAGAHADRQQRAACFELPLCHPAIHPTVSEKSSILALSAASSCSPSAGLRHLMPPYIGLRPPLCSLPLYME